MFVRHFTQITVFLMLIRFNKLNNLFSCNIYKNLTWIIFWVLILFFFVQAEDGIRDHCVTGVQTCALPIPPGQLSPADIQSAPTKYSLTLFQSISSFWSSHLVFVKMKCRTFAPTTPITYPSKMKPTMRDMDSLLQSIKTAAARKSVG